MTVLEHIEPNLTISDLHLGLFLDAVLFKLMDLAIVELASAELDSVGSVKTEGFTNNKK